MTDGQFAFTFVSARNGVSVTSAEGCRHPRVVYSGTVVARTPAPSGTRDSLDFVALSPARQKVVGGSCC